MDWIKIEKGVAQDCTLSPCLFNFYAEYTMWNATLDEAQAGIKISGRNINNLRYADDTILMAETEEELNSLLIISSQRGEWKSWLKIQHSKNEDHGIQSHHFMQANGVIMKTVIEFIFLGSKITAASDCSYEIKRCFLLGRKAMKNLYYILKSRDTTL